MDPLLGWELSFIYLRDDATCSLCGGYVSVADATRDHVVPRSRGGTSAMTNLRLAHRRCNELKGDGVSHFLPLD